MANTLRLQKFLAHAGLGSRRKMEKHIASGEVAVNGKVVTEQGVKIDPGVDEIKVNGRVITIGQGTVYFWLNKPVGVVSSAKRQYDETLVTDYVTHTRVWPVGRLDKESEGLLLLTNDGPLTHRLTHPKFHVDKTYEVLVDGQVTPAKLDRLRGGIELEEGITAPAQVDHIGSDPEGEWLQFVIHEGKHRQIRRMCTAVRLKVRRLVRVAFGPVLLGSLPSGQLRPASQAEIMILNS